MYRTHAVHSVSMVAQHVHYKGSAYLHEIYVGLHKLSIAALDRAHTTKMAALDFFDVEVPLHWLVKSQVRATSANDAVTA